MRLVVLMAACSLALTTTAQAQPHYLHKTTARHATLNTVLAMFHDIYTYNPGAHVSGYSVASPADCRHHGARVVTCGYTLLFRGVTCPGVMRVRWGVDGLESVPRLGECY